MSIRTFPALAVLLATAPLAAHAALIDFEAAASAGSYYTVAPNPYIEDGYRVAAVSAATADTGNATSFAGSVGIFSNAANGLTTLTAVGGGVFGLYSIDLSRLSTTLACCSTVSFNGNVFGGGTLSQGFTVSSALVFQTFTFSGFQNLTSVTWNQTAAPHQFDNICIGSGPCSVPEPGSLALAGLGLLGLGFSRRRFYLAVRSASDYLSAFLNIGCGAYYEPLAPAVIAELDGVRLVRDRATRGAIFSTRATRNSWQTVSRHPGHRH